MKMAALNVLMNAFLAVIFVSLSNRALANGLEETLVSLALLFGLAVVLANGVFVARVCSQQKTQVSSPSPSVRS